MIVIVLVIALAIAFSEQEGPTFEEAKLALLASGVWTALAMAIGWGCASALRLSLADRVTFVIEFSARNVAVATIVAISGLGRLDLTYFSGTYVTVGYGLIGAFTFWARRRLKAQPGATPT